MPPVSVAMAESSDSEEAPGFCGALEALWARSRRSWSEFLPCLASFAAVKDTRDPFYAFRGFWNKAGQLAKPEIQSFTPFQGRPDGLRAP